jgi:hypothetical protein
MTLLLSTATLAVTVVTTSVRAAEAPLGAYLRGAERAAAERTATGAVRVDRPMIVRGHVSADGRIYDAHVVGSSGSLETDVRVTRALRRLKTPEPPIALIGAAVRLSLEPSAVMQAANP